MGVVQAALHEDYQLIGFDRRGFGDSDRRTSPPDLVTHDVVAVLGVT
jgi:pimeloyl-ACP methyl ester carboxylesterase